MSLQGTIILHVYNHYDQTRTCMLLFCWVHVIVLDCTVAWLREPSDVTNNY